MGYFRVMLNPLRSIRKSRKWTQEKMAAAMGISPGGYRHLEYGTRRLKVDQAHVFAEKLGPAIIPGDGAEAFVPPSTSGKNGRSTEPYKPVLPRGVPEIDAEAGAGPGTVGQVYELRSNGILSGHKVIDEWVIPPSQLGVEASRVIILPVEGTSMEPILKAGDRVMVDTGVSSIKHGEIYVLDEGDGPIVKRARVLRDGDEPQIEILSENPAVTPTKRPASLVRVIGRNRMDKPQLDDQAQTLLAMAALFASLVKGIEKQGLCASSAVLSEIEAIYRQLRESPTEPIRAMETLHTQAAPSNTSGASKRSDFQFHSTLVNCFEPEAPEETSGASARTGCAPSTVHGRIAAGTSEAAAAAIRWRHASVNGAPVGERDAQDPGRNRDLRRMAKLPSLYPGDHDRASLLTDCSRQGVVRTAPCFFICAGKFSTNGALAAPGDLPMHPALETSQTTAPRKIAMRAATVQRFDRSEITRKAWALWKLAQDVATRPAFDGTAIRAAAMAAGANRRQATEISDRDYADRRAVKGITSFGDAMRAAWASAKAAVEADRRRADVAARSVFAMSVGQDAIIIAGVASFRND
eukprot:gene20170-20724_t